MGEAPDEAGVDDGAACPGIVDELEEDVAVRRVGRECISDNNRLRAHGARQVATRLCQCGRFGYL